MSSVNSYVQALKELKSNSFQNPIVIDNDSFRKRAEQFEQECFLYESEQFGENEEEDDDGETGGDYKTVVDSTIPCPTPPSADPQLLAFYKLDSLEDSTGNGYGLQNDNEVTFTEGLVGNCALFNGTNHLSNPCFPLGDYSSLSLSFWFNSPDLGSGSKCCLFLGSTDLSHGLAFYCDTTNNVSYYLNNSSDVGYFGSTPVETNRWYHFALTLLKEGDFVTAKLYIDGTLVHTKTGTEWFNDPLHKGISIGKAPNISSNVIGRIDSVGIWNYELSSEQVSDLYNSGSGFEPL